MIVECIPCVTQFLVATIGAKRDDVVQVVTKLGVFRVRLWIDVMPIESAPARFLSAHLASVLVSVESKATNLGESVCAEAFHFMFAM